MKTERIKNQSIRCYDNGGKTADRYTVVFLDQPERAVNTFVALGMNSTPFHPQGFGQHTAAMPGRHLGKRIAFASLPEDCQKLVEQNCTIELDEFTRGYIRAALWSSNDESTPSGGEPLDKNYSPDDIAFSALEKIILDCRKFQSDNAGILAKVSYPKNDSTDLAHAGHDFWLTRNGHGAGFWDGDLPEEIGDALTKASKAHGEFSLYFGEDGLIYGS